MRSSPILGVPAALVCVVVSAACAVTTPPSAPPAAVVVLPPASADPLLVASPGPPAERASLARLTDVDVSWLDAREHAEWSALVGELVSPCASVAVPLAECVAEKRDCKACSFAASWVARAVHRGASGGEVHSAYAARFDPAAVRQIPVAGAPSEGPASAPVTIVEFVDLECPHCKVGVELVDALLASNPGAVRVVYKAYPIEHHAHAVDAACAAFAADRQGKFWEMLHALLAHQDKLEPRDVEGYARTLRLDLARWRADMKSPAVAQRVDDDRKAGDALGIKGTPTFYVDGRELGSDESLAERVREELDFAGK
ncbi:MAG TPA: thioredoxin domain-containing protein [Polyangiaceae bacterium]|jgi:protein-disulfide isomerase